jgi:multiple antibiotic resistance protein
VKVDAMGEEEKREKKVSFERQLSEWIIGRHSRVFRVSLFVVLALLVFWVSFRLSAGGLREWVQVEPAVIVNISIQLYAIINPISAVPTFLMFTGNLKRNERQKIVNTITMIVIALILTFAFFGPILLQALDVSVANFRLGGGILLMILAVDMLGGISRSKSVDLQQVAVVPLATPLLVGPGTMTTLIVQANSYPIINVIVGGLIATIGVYITLWAAPMLASALGKNGIQALSRIMAVILAAIASQMIYLALYDWGIAKV